MLYHADIESSTTSIWHARACIVRSPKKTSAYEQVMRALLFPQFKSSLFLCHLFVIARSESAHDGMLRSLSHRNQPGIGTSSINPKTASVASLSMLVSGPPLAELSFPGLQALGPGGAASAFWWLRIRVNKKDTLKKNFHVQRRGSAAAFGRCPSWSFAALQLCSSSIKCPNPA